MSTHRVLAVSHEYNNDYPAELLDEMGANASESIEFDDFETEGGHVVWSHHVVIARDVFSKNFRRQLPDFDWIDSPVEWTVTLASVCCVRSIQSSKARELLGTARSRRVVI